MARADTMEMAAYRVAYRILGQNHQTGTHRTEEAAMAAYEDAVAYNHVEAAMLLQRNAGSSRFNPSKVLA